MIAICHDFAINGSARVESIAWLNCTKPKALTSMIGHYDNGPTFSDAAAYRAHFFSQQCLLASACLISGFRSICAVPNAI